MKTVRIIGEEPVYEVPAIELRNLRDPGPGLMGNADHRFASHVRLVDMEGREVRMTRDEWVELGKPAYVVCYVRAETRREATQ